MQPCCFNCNSSTGVSLSCLLPPTQAERALDTAWMLALLLLCRSTVLASELLNRLLLAHLSRASATPLTLTRWPECLSGCFS